MQQSHFLFRSFSLFNGYTKIYTIISINVPVAVHTTTMIAQKYDLILNSKTKLTKNAVAEQKRTNAAKIQQSLSCL